MMFDEYDQRVRIPVAAVQDVDARKSITIMTCGIDNFEIVIGTQCAVITTIELSRDRLNELIKAYLPKSI